MSDEHTRPYDERCEYIADTIDEHQVFMVPSVGYGDLSSVGVKGWEADVDFSMDVVVKYAFSRKIGNRVKNGSSLFGIQETDSSNYIISIPNDSMVEQTLTVPKSNLTGTRHIFKVDPVALKMSIDNVEQDITAGNMFPKWLFWWGYNSSTLGSYFADTNTKVYSLKLFAQDGTLLYNYIPVRVGNKGQLYDTVNKIMLTSVDYSQQA